LPARRELLAGSRGRGILNLGFLRSAQRDEAHPTRGALLEPRVGLYIAAVTEYVEQLEKRLRSARRIRNVYLAAAVAVPALFGGVFAYQDRFNALALAQVETVVAEVVFVTPPDPGEPSALMVRYEHAGKMQGGLLREPGLPNAIGSRFPVKVTTDTGTLVSSTLAPPPDDTAPQWQTRAIALICGFFPFALMSFNYEARRRSLARNLRLRTSPTSSR